MQSVDVIMAFLKAVEEDPKITSAHISIFMVLVKIWYERGCPSAIVLFSREAMSKAKISGRATYFRCLQDLNDFGYLKYEPSYNYLHGSTIILSVSK